MAVATNVRVEATSQSTTTVRWTDTASSGEAIYRSTDGSSYALVDTSTTPTTGLGSYEDTGLSAGTKYWYKLSNDAGSNFSSVVTVYTHSCGVPNAQQSDLALPRVGGEVTPDSFNAMADAVETSLTKFTSPQGQTCVACITDGALVIDCVTYADCQSIEVAVDQDINSISLPNCDNSIVDIGFIIPPNVTRKIGGWPKGIGFTGDEGNTAPISGGASGRFVNEFLNRGQNINGKSGKSKPGTTTQGTAQGGNYRVPGGGCVPGAFGELTISPGISIGGANVKNHSMSCSEGANLQGVTLSACGGHEPYTWSKTGAGIEISTVGNIVTVRPVTNAGSAVAGTAYLNRHYICISTTCSGVTCTNVQAESEAAYGCNDNFIQCQAVSGGAAPTGAAVGAVCCPEIAEERCPSGTCTSAGFGSGVNVFADMRTAPMIAAGCTPCGTNANGATVTVTDALGAQTTITLTA